MLTARLPCSPKPRSVSPPEAAAGHCRPAPPAPCLHPWPLGSWGWVGGGVRGLWGVGTCMSGARAPRRRSSARLSGSTHLLPSRISPACRLLRVPGPPPAPPEEEENRDQHALGSACPGPRGGGAGARRVGGVVG